MNVVAALEALLFACGSPTSSAELGRVLGLTEGQVEEALDVLALRLNQGSGLQLVEIAGGYQLSTRPDFAGPVAELLKPERNKLSKSLLEVLAIVAYKQPITMSEIEVIRGVQSDYGVKSLLERRLIREVGRRPTPGRPVLFGTTQQFLHQFNLNALEDLPAIDGVTGVIHPVEPHPALPFEEEAAQETEPASLPFREAYVEAEIAEPESESPDLEASFSSAESNEA